MTGTKRDKQAAKPVWRTALSYASSDGVPRRSLRVALVVGTILNVINQGDAVFGGDQVSWFKALLTFFVPYAVSTYGVVSYRLGADRDAARERGSAM